ncbi:beta-galactosidase [Candidatus Bathyarchaeota archaeon]|nr:beta-galactosidase [Candidatus Bathyarchaeota archaeon]
MSVPRPEHPRPDFERKNWINLNGEWQFEIDNAKSGLEKGWNSGRDLSRRIIVPFPPESPLSGIGEKDFMESVWYRRFFKIPDKWLDGRVLLHFGAVDYKATVWVNGHMAGFHKGGFTPFSFDITELLEPGENELTVWAIDECRSGLQPTGKQSHRLKSYGCLYTRVTGIWQTVWLESVPRQYIKYFKVIAEPSSEELFLEFHIGGDEGECEFSAQVYDGNKIIAEAKILSFKRVNHICMRVPDVHLWSPEDPHLYNLVLRLASGDSLIDEVSSYVGFREIRRFKNKILLNNQVRFLRFVLDQGYYPDGIYTAPSDDALRRDIELAKDMGFDGARLHQKVFEPRFLYWADKLGYLVAGEFPDWGADLSNATARDSLLDEWISVVKRDFNHPSIIIWTPFNERIISVNDQACVEFIRRVTYITKVMDPTRLIIDCSGYTHVSEEIDIYDAHDYEQNPVIFKEHYANLPEKVSIFKPRPGFLENMPYKGQPFIVSEYGGTWWNPWEAKPGESWGYGERPKTIEEFIARYRVLTESLLFNENISGFCYTQLYDIEQEANGLYTFDRKPKVDPNIIREINRQKARIEITLPSSVKSRRNIN